MAKPPKKQATPKTPEQAMDELTELSQEFGLYDVEGNPLVKDESTMPLEAPTEPLQAIAEEINATVAKTDETPISIGLDPLNAAEELGELLDKVTEENKHPELIPTIVVGSVLVEGVHYEQSGLDGAKVESVGDKIRVTTAEGEVKEFTEPPELSFIPVDDKLTLKDAWGRPVPTTLITLQTVNYTELVSQVLYAASLDAELDRSYRIMTTVPYRIRLLLPTENYEKWISKEDVMVYDENVSYNKVLVRGFSLYPFWDNVVKVGKSGAMVVPRTVAQKVAGYMVSCYTRAPIADTPESRVSLSKIKYTKEELESFTLESLKIVASWYEGIPSMNSKIKYIKEILVKQGG